MNSTLAKPADWRDLFLTEKSSGTEKVRWRVLRKHGEPLLVLPESPGAALVSLALYPAQAGKARVLLGFLRLALKLRLSLPLERAEVLVAAGEPFCKYLIQQAGSKAFPQLAIFCGNPRTAGRRFIVLLFGEQSEPVRVVKVGMGQASMNLIQCENKFLNSAPPDVTGIPKFSGSFEGGNVSAFALEFLSGDFPGVADYPVVQKILNAWVEDSRSITLAEAAPWREMESTCANHPLLKRLTSLQSASVPGVIWHGDLAPWNMKVNRVTGRCVVFDWERGQLSGVPGWDWFHYVLQPAVLVEKLPAPALRDKFENLLRSSEFVAYAKRCGIVGRERELLLAYLLFNVEVLKPSEGREVTRALLELLENSWTSDSKS